MNRLSATCIDLDATCGMCGGRLLIHDWQARDAWRYEVYCNGCGRCDPRGYGSLREAEIEGAAYFEGKT